MQLPADDDFSAPALPEWRSAPESGRVLVFAAHPDDECAGPGGALLLHRRQGDPVRVVIATDGRAGDPDRRYDEATYVERRQNESRTGMAHLEVDDFVFWGYPDDCVITDNDVEMIASRAEAEVEAYRPDIVYLPWTGDAHTDHRAVHCGVVRCLRRTGFAGIAYGYETWSAMLPDLILDISPVVEEKRRALACYESQLAYNDYLHPVFGLNAFRSMQFNKGKGHAEAFERLRIT